jgi:hypothetical protein
MHGSKWKKIFIKDNIARDINSTSLDIETFYPFVARAIAKENASCR